MIVICDRKTIISIGKALCCSGRQVATSVLEDNTFNTLQIPMSDNLVFSIWLSLKSLNWDKIHKWYWKFQWLLERVQKHVLKCALAKRNHQRNLYLTLTLLKLSVLVAKTLHKSSHWLMTSDLSGSDIVFHYQAVPDHSWPMVKGQEVTKYSQATSPIAQTKLVNKSQNIVGSLP